MNTGMTDATSGDPTTNPNKISGNYNQQIATCYKIPKDQVATYGKDDIFDIKVLQAGWTGASTGSVAAAGNVNCQRTAYGIFDSTGAKVLNHQTGASDSYAYWASMREACMKKPSADVLKDPTKNKSLYRCYTMTKELSTTSAATIPDDGFCRDPYKKKMRVNSMIQDFEDQFSYVSSSQGGSAAANFNFNCRDPAQMTFTQCKVPGWEYMKYDPTRGWVQGDMTQCGQNPIFNAGGKPITGQYTEKNPGTACGKNGTCCDPIQQDNRPNVMDGADGSAQGCSKNGCCVSVKDWQNDFGSSPDNPGNHLFSHKDAQDTTTTVAGQSYQDIIAQGCDSANGHVCIASTVVSDTAGEQICKTCAQFAGQTDMSSAKITFGTGANAATLPYVGTNGVATTPKTGTTGFSDVRECQTGQAFDGQCQGLTGCAGTSDPGDISHTKNTCATGQSYIGTDPYFTDPSANCPNIFTLARNSTAPSCPTSTDFDSSSATPDLRNVDSVTLPEGAWVTAYYSPAQNGVWGDGQGLCAPPTSTQTKIVLQMGVGKYTVPGTQEVKVQGVASIYVYGPDGTMTPIQNTPSTYTCSAISGMQNGTNACAASQDVVKVVGNKDGTFTFSYLNSALNNTTYIGQGDNESWGGWTFGFMPGYYKSTYNTNNGPCGATSS